MLAYLLGSLAVLGWISWAVVKLAREEDASVRSPIEVRSPTDRHLEGVRMSVFRDGKLDWDIRADEAVADESWDHIEFTAVHVDSRLNDSESLESRAPTGRVDRPVDVFELSGGVLTVADVNVAPEPTVDEKKTEKIEIKSDRMTAHEKDNKATFEGNVVATTADYFVKAETMDANYDPKTHEILGFTGKGSVKVIDRKDPTTWGEGKEGVYDKKNGEIVLTGEPRIHQGDKISAGDKVLVTLSDKKMVVLGSDKQPVQTIVPEKDVRQ